MFKTLAVTLATIAAIIAMGVTATQFAKGEVSVQPAQSAHHVVVDYSFKKYYNSLNTPVEYCELPPVKVVEDYVERATPVPCNNNGKLPDRAQTNIWEGYTLWVSCMKYGATEACQSYFYN